MASPTSTDDIESRWRPLTDAETVVATTRLEDAWRKLKRDVPDVESRMGTDSDLSEDVDQVLADSVIRVLQAIERNGVRRGSVTIDDSSRSWDVDDASIELYFTDAELASVRPATEERRPRAFSVQPS